ncbi:hypothetical protein FLG15_06830 [Xanthomonas phaseoli pv. dieffenbachiae]|uniref:Uncharacterized protein n=1 Tax=Xanthomonas phaseoli pv. dieffenbachiae TaxID=92828 RepID=A0A1V9H457_9XANT|nr:hypothetical protein IM53_014165 [Xanthomonas phaseoli pv. dieffenbachiae]
MSILAFQPEYLKSIPQGVHVIRHPAGTLPDRDAIVAALPRTGQGTPQLHYDTLWIGGGHGDVDNQGAPTKLNDCTGVEKVTSFIEDLVTIGIRTPALIVDSCFSLAWLPQFAPLLTEDGMFAGWSSICNSNRIESLTSGQLPALVEQLETALAQVTTAASSQVVYIARDRVLIRYGRLTAIGGVMTAGDIADAEATLARVGKATWQGRPLIATDQRIEDRTRFIERLHQL